MQLNTLAQDAMIDQDYQGICNIIRIGETLETATRKGSSLRIYLGHKPIYTLKSLTLQEMPNGGLLIYKDKRVFIPSGKRKEIIKLIQKYIF